ncbi:PD-(D/E)XK nuclease-like domain-containing protein [Pectobacterium brasiliense]|uniref:PD-(D/E)XK nuclease-like domain-containing protein n=1 Tax=Pectobacterium brasiliense TaxID=180957 RepID=UPI001969E988|nr:PD-(D/E)XK nuclease-like domain-containing protein [Pectobacterium brasiliense]MBN3093520.1 PD-(D/E)XK nuclease-like domain-containing protein [Pectobacterium brasiliense]
MNTYAFLIKAKAKSDKKSLFCWLSAKSDSRADREIMNILEDEEIQTGRGGDYNLPLRTDWFVVDDLPEEGALDDTWCDRYELNDDGKSWRQIPKSELVSTNIQDEHADITGQTTSTQLADVPATDGTITIDQASFTQRVLVAWMFGSPTTTLSPMQQRDISTLQHDMDATYAQNLLLALNNAKELLQVQHVFPDTLFSLIDSIKSVWPRDGKAPPVGDIVSFSKEWLNARNEDSTLERSGPYRHEVTAKWAKKSGVQRTESGAIAGGGNKTDRNPDYTHTLDTLDIEIALATLPMDFDIYEIPVSLHRRAKEIIANKEEPFKTWSQKLRAMPGILDYSRAAIFALIRGANADITHFPESMQRYINANLTESDHANPTPETLQQARQHNSASTVLSKIDSARAGESVDSGVVLNTAFQTVGDALVQEAAQQAEPAIKNVGKGMFAIDGLMGNTPSNEGEKPENDGVDNVQMETAGNQSSETNSAVSASANDDGSIEEAKAALESAVNKWVGEGGQPEEPAEPVVTDEPPYFEPGRYEGVSNNDYHTANGISSTQVKDARISLMYYHGRHITKTIRRDSSDALTFGSLVHTLALEPEKLKEEYAVFPGVPASAFTNTDTLKSWIREYNADKPKSEQLKLTGKKEELQEAIRAVNPSAIFADEFESQWCASVSDKTILTAEQLQAATAIQQALFNHPTAGKLLQHTARAVEVSYFGMDEGTGLEVRVRPDLELELGGLRIAADVKTISLGKVKQDNLRAKLHREIIDRDYHVSAAMYSEVADFDQFFWIFVNKDEGYHWVAVIEASTDLLELGSLEYHRTMRDLANAYDTDAWPAPVTTDYTDELNDFDQRRLEALRMA